MKDIYRALCQTEPTIPLFSQAWWLDSVAGDSWDVVTVEKGGEIQAAMPYMVKKKWGLTLLTQPPLTQHLGPWIRPSNAKYAKRLSREKKLMDELIDQLPTYHHFQQNWHHERRNWLPFYWKGFSQTTRYTYIIENILDIDEVWGMIDSSYRNKIRKAEKIVTIHLDLNINDFYKINEMTFSRQGVNVPYSRDFLISHDEILKKNDSRKIFYAMDEDQNIHSALYLTWDESTAYVHMVGENPDLRTSGAGILLIWEAIKYASKVLKKEHFDFEGSMLENVEKVRRDFGAHQIPYYVVSHTPSRVLRLAMAARSLLK